jgi:hypothetical protein
MQETRVNHPAQFLVLGSCLLGLLSNHEDGSSKFLSIVDATDHFASHPR